MTDVDDRRLRIQSDLRLVVDNDTRATLVADGQHLTLATDDAGRLLAHAMDSARFPGSPGWPSLVRDIGRRLDAVGLSAHVVTGRGTLLELGRDCRSRTGRVLLGSEFVRPGTGGAIASTLAGYARASAGIRHRAGYSAAGLAIAALVTWAGLRQRVSARVPVS